MPWGAVGDLGGTQPSAAASACQSLHRRTARKASTQVTLELRQRAKASVKGLHTQSQSDRGPAVACCSAQGLGLLRDHLMYDSAAWESPTG